MRIRTTLALGSSLTIVSFSAVLAAHTVYCPNPGLDCTRVLVVPVKYVPPYCPDPGQPCIDDVSIFHDPPRIPASHLAEVLEQRVNPNFDAWSHGTWQFQFDVLVDPFNSDGWWPMPASFQSYHLAELAGADLWKKGPAQRAVVQDAIETIAAQASEAGLIPSLANYSRILVLDNNHGRGGQSNQATYAVPVYSPLSDMWFLMPHVFTGSLVGVGMSDDALEPLLSHELTHQLGPGDFYGVCLINETPLIPFDDECNGPWDVMADDLAGPNHPTAYNKLFTGWLPEDAQHVLDLPVVGSAYSTAVDLHPIEDFDPSHIRLVRIPLALTLPDALFEGYHLECRRRINGDENLPEIGVLIQFVREAEPGVAQNGPMPARVVHADPPFDSVVTAALQEGESWVDVLHGISVAFSGFADATPQSACEVQVTYSATGAKPDPAFKVIGGGSPDLWMDSPLNGAEIYPPNQPKDADGVPAGPGDPFTVGITNSLRFRVRNLGTAPTPTLAVRLIAEQPPYAACGATPPRILDMIRFVDPIQPGGTANGGVNLKVPKSQMIRVRAKILPVAGEVTTSNNEAERTFGTGSGSSVITPDGPGPVTVGLGLINGCPNHISITTIPKLMPLLPIPDPDPVFDRWRASDPGLIRLAPGESVPVSMTFLPPNPITPGSGVTIPLSVIGGGFSSKDSLLGQAGHEVDTFAIEIPVVAPAALTAALPPGPLKTGSRIGISGYLTPAVAGTVVGLRFTSPTQQEILNQVTTDGQGFFSAGFGASVTGRWTFEAVWQGDDTRSEARSTTRTFIVVPNRACQFDPDCNDGNPCTQDFCDPGFGRCEYGLWADGTVCDDGNRCTTGGTCVAGACGQPVTCDDLSDCTSDSCNPVTGQCVFSPVPLSEVSPVGFESPTRLAWPPTPDASYWNTYRGTIPAGLLGSRRDAYDDTCFEIEDALGDGVLRSTDSAAPAAGTAFYYAVTERTLCGEGPAGLLQSGAPRTPPSPCIAP